MARARKTNRKTQGQGRKAKQAPAKAKAPQKRSRTPKGRVVAKADETPEKRAREVYP